jgi:hypothetical protein
MYRIINKILLILILAFLLQSGCAWENLPEGDETEKDLRMTITFRVQGQLDPNLFYFIVFNFSGDPSKKPKPDFEDEERGLNWDAYYMYGNPRLEGHDFYRGLGIGQTKDGTPYLDLRPVQSKKLTEFVTTSYPPVKTIPVGNQIVLELDFGKTKPPPSVNMNMMVSSLPIDRVDNPDDGYDALVYDSFKFDGITLNLGGTKTDFHEQETPMEDEENIGENPPPNANIIFWRVQIL